MSINNIYNMGDGKTQNYILVTISKQTLGKTQRYEIAAGLG